MKSEKGQALAETSLIATVAILLIFGTLSLIVLHRARTLAITASYACAQFLSQAPDPAQAYQDAYQVASDVLKSDWGGLVLAEFQVQISPPSGAATAGSCTVRYSVPFLHQGLFGFPEQQSAVSFLSRSEAWKARWQP